MFPPANLYTQNNWSANHTSPFVFLLPFLEYRSLYNSINSSLSNFDSAQTPLVQNGTARRTRIETFLCPSDGGSNHLNTYRLNHGRYARGRTTPFDGPFSIGVIPSQASITDGLSRTAFVSERVSGSFDKRPDSHRDIKVSTLVPGYLYSTDEQLIEECLSMPSSEWNTTAGRFWMYDGMNDTEYNHNGQPNDPRVSCGITEAGLYPPRSFHYGTVNVLFGDGHAERVSNTIALETWRSLGSYDSND
jgi:prepilin-type processing-associated H-X9-DG protein